MSAIINRYSHVFSTWEVYPRVHFFQRRFVDLHRRFKTLTGAFPSTYNDPNVLSDIEKLNYALGKSLTVTVFGKEDIRSSEFAVPRYEIDDKPESGINVLICHARMNDTDENSLQDVEDMLNQATKTLEGKQSLDFVVCYCDTCPDSSENDVIEALLQVSTRVNEAHGYKGIAPENIIIGKNAFTLQNKISELLESRIVDGLVKISSYLQRFVRVDRHYDQENLDILNTKSCVKAVQDFLGNGYNLYDMRLKAATEEVFLDQVIYTLSSIIRCAVVPAMATKHNLQLWMCDKLLQEIKFEKSLRENISKNSRYHLSKLEKYYFEVSNTPSTPVSSTQTKSHDFDFLVYLLHKDLAGVVTNAEKKLSTMQYLTNVMRKMMCEIKGYMRQTVVQLQSQDEPDFSAPDIADQLREKVLALEGVYAIGTLYGQLEIHLDKNNAEDSSDVRAEITAIMNECQFQHPYVIKEVSMKPKRMAKDFYEQGDTLRCPFPDNYDSFREGTLGCFVKGRDNNHYGLTCAHVVDPKPNSKLNVMVQKRGQTYKHFGKSQDNLCVRPSEGSLQHIDIAAVMVYHSVTQLCNLTLKDDIGQIKPAHVVNKSRKELTESFVFKSGAKTGITKGIIASADYNIAVENLPEHLILIEPLPADDEKDIKEKALELVNGDIGNLSQTHDSVDKTTARSHVMLAGCGCKQTYESDQSYCGVDSQRNSPPNMRKSESTELCSVAPGIENLQLDAGACGISCGMSFNEVNQFRDGCTVFAEQGDSGSIVCMLDLESKSVSAISMVSAGDLQLKGYGIDGFESKMCISFLLADGMQELGMKYKEIPDFFKFE